MRRALGTLSKMGFSDKYKEVYIAQEHAPDLHIMQLSMIAEEFIESLQIQAAG